MQVRCPGKLDRSSCLWCADRYARHYACLRIWPPPCWPPVMCFRRRRRIWRSPRTMDRSRCYRLSFCPPLSPASFRARPLRIPFFGIWHILHTYSIDFTIKVSFCPYYIRSMPIQQVIFRRHRARCFPPTHYTSGLALSL